MRSCFAQEFQLLLEILWNRGQLPDFEPTQTSIDYVDLVDI
jgi:hypothetical protein